MTTIEKEGIPMSERKYRIKEGWIFNLEAMHDKLNCIGYDLDDGTIQGPIEILGYKLEDSCDIQKLLEECSKLEWAAKSRLVTSKEFGRIKEIVEWRVMQRYSTCLASGNMTEAEAGQCFEDL